MSQEQNLDLIQWWDQQSFTGKDLFALDETGTLTLRANNNIKEREIARVSPENADVVLKTLTEKFAEAEAKVREMEVEWLAADDKLKLADKVAHLKDYLYQLCALGDFEKPVLLVHDWQHTLYVLSEENYAAKLKLAELAGSLAENDQWKETTQVFRDIADKWKQLGYTDKAKSDKLWAKIEAARKTFHDRKRLHNADEEKELLHNLDLKIDLVEQAEGIAKSEEWKKTSDAFIRLTEEWKTIGHTLNKKNEELWQRFMAAKIAFFDRKREHSKKIHEEQEINYPVKLALVERAEALTDSTEWNVTAQTYAALMEEWKKTGRVAHDKSDELWKRFIGAQEHFFEAKHKHTEAIRAEHENNYQLKKALLDRVEQIKNSSRWGEVTGEMSELMEQWKKTGPVQRARGDKLWGEFLAARKHFFARKDANRDQRQQHYEDQKTIRVEQARNMVSKLEKEIREEEEKLADFKNGLENITPGITPNKKVAELRAHLETLIADCETKLKRMREKSAAVHAETKIPEQEPVASEENSASPE